MARAVLALILILTYGAVAFGWRSWHQYRRTRDTGLRLAPGDGALGRVGHLAVVASFAASFTAPVAALVAGHPAAPGGPTGLVDGGTGAVTLVLGLVLGGIGAVGTVVAQLQMGESWRVGVDAQEETALVTHGLFARVRNPIFTAMVVGFAGLALLVPNAVAIAGVLLAVVGLQLQVRFVEEPYLCGVHGRHYQRWAARSGRFLPGLGRLSSCPGGPT